MARNVFKIIDSVLEHIPKEHTMLRSRLERIKLDGLFTPPEGVQLIWAKLENALETNLSIPPQHNWEMEIHDIIKGEPPPDSKPFIPIDPAAVSPPIGGYKT